jgi:hypothetical protein
MHWWPHPFSAAGAQLFESCVSVRFSESVVQPATSQSQVLQEIPHFFYFGEQRLRELGSADLVTL